MTRIELAPELGEDFDRIFEHLASHASPDPAARIEEIIQAFDVLETNPLIGRALAGDTRELVIGRRSHGYVALYGYAAGIDTVFILALRGQREAGHRRG